MRPIDADELRKRLEDGVWNDAVAEVDAMPTIEAVTVVHGEWIARCDGRYGQTRTYCSVCGKHSGIGGIKQKPPFCPNCGAKMRGAE